MSTPVVESPSSAPERKGFYVRGWVLAAIAAVVLLVAAVTIGLAVRDDGDGREGRGRFFDHHGGDGHPGLKLLIFVILIALAIAAAVFITRRVRSQPSNKRTNAEGVLAERFARGEIDESDYLSRRAALRS